MDPPCSLVSVASASRWSLTARPKVLPIALARTEFTAFRPVRMCSDAAGLSATTSMGVTYRTRVPALNPRRCDRATWRNSVLSRGSSLAQPLTRAGCSLGPSCSVARLHCGSI